MMILHIPLVPPPPPASNHWSTLWTKIKIFVWFWSILPQIIFVLNFGSLSYELRKSKSKKIQTLYIHFPFFLQILKKSQFWRFCPKVFSCMYWSTKNARSRMCCPCGDACSQDRENSLSFFRGLSVRSASLKCWMQWRGAVLDPRKWHVVHTSYISTMN